MAEIEQTNLEDADQSEVPPRIQIKGIREGLLITLGEGSSEALYSALLAHLDQQGEFLKGAKVALDVGNRMIRVAELGQLRSQISDRQITLWAVISNSPTTERSAQMLGLATRINRPRVDAPTVPRPTPPQEGESAVLVQRTLRSGASLKYNGHVIVIGDVNPGAEIISAGDIIVWGHLRGMVHAGAEGDESAVVCALDLSPTQLRIASQIVTTPQRRGKGHPEMVRIVNGQVAAEPWNPKK